MLLFHSVVYSGAKRCNAYDATKERYVSVRQNGKSMKQIFEIEYKAYRSCFPFGAAELFQSYFILAFVRTYVRAYGGASNMFIWFSVTIKVARHASLYWRAPTIRNTSNLQNVLLLQFIFRLAYSHSYSLKTNKINYFISTIF